MGQNAGMDVGEVLRVFIGPLLLAAGLVYGLYRYRHGRVGSAIGQSPPAVTGGLVAFVALGVIAIVTGSVMVSRYIDKAASTTGSSTRPKEPGSGVDRAPPTSKGERAPLQDSNVPPAQPK
jgi:hypothetical protein